MRKITFLKSLLVATMLMGGGASSVWAEDSYFGSATKVCGAWTDSSKSKTYGVPKGGNITINFTITTNDDNDTYRLDPDDVEGAVNDNDKKWKKWFTWLIDASCGGWQFAFRADNLTGSNWHGDLTPTISYSDNFETMYTRANMTGADVKLEISRDENNQVTVLATTTKGSDTWWKKEIITLGSGAGDNLMTFFLSGDNCYGQIHSAVSNKHVGTTENSTTWWNNFSDYYTINANKTLTLNFKNYSSKNENWSNFVTVITNDVDRGGTGYAEQVVLRVDDYGWGTNYNHSKFSNNYNWTSFKNDMDGASVELKIRRLDTKVAVKATYTTTAGQKYYQQYVYTSPSGTDPLRVFLTVDNSHITDLTSSTADTPNSANEYLYTIKAVDGNNKDLRTFSTGAYWTGESAITLAIPQYILSGTSLLGVAKQSDDYWYRVSVTPNKANYVHKVTYNNESISNVVYFTEAEDIGGFTESTSGSITSRASGGKCARSAGAFKNLTTLSAGKYKVYVRGNADDSDSRKVSIKAGDNLVLDNWVIGHGTDQKTNVEFTLSSSTTISAACSATGSTGLDWVYIQKTGEPVSISQYGWATFSSNYALDFSSVTGLTAYMITGHEGDVVTKSEVTETVPAGTGLLLKGTQGNYDIPVVGSSDTNVSSNLMVAGTGAAVSYEAGKTKYVLGVSGAGLAEFQRIVDGTPATVTEGKAYLQFNEDISNAHLRFDFDESTGIESLNSQAEGRSEVFNLAGQRVAQPTRGLYIVNGKKVFIK